MYDFAILGGGSAGCVLAERLSQVRSHKVILIEAGPDYADLDQVPSEILSGSAGPVVTHDWGFQSTAGSLGHRIALPRARESGTFRYQRSNSLARTSQRL